jgi:hypothetical protein
MSFSDYATRKYDYLALQNTNARKKTKLALELFNSNSSGTICVGAQKLAQRWLLEFMTETGSMPGRPTRGCDFMRNARTGKFLTKASVATAFVLSNVDVRRNLVNEEYADMPADERFLSAELLAANVIPDSTVGVKTATSAAYLNLTVKINSRAGDSRQVIVPIEVLPKV